MIRIVIALFSFAVVLCGWIVLRDSDAPVTEGVTRTQSADLVTPVAAAAIVTAPATPPQPSALRQRLAAQGRTTLTPLPGRAMPQATATQIQQVVAQAIAPTTAPMAEDPIATLAQAGGDSDLSKSVISGILQARGLGSQPAKPQALSLAAAVSQAMNQGQSDAYVQALLEAAHADAGLGANGALTTEDGKVDTRTLLSQIVSQAGSGGAAAQAVQPELIGGPGVEVRTIQRAEGTESYTFYTVQPGDSLGYIAQKFYGDASLFPKIWEANRQIVSSPDRIRKGQRLVIPAAT